MLNVTRNERDMLEALAACPDRGFTLAQLIRDNPALLGRRSHQGLHVTAASLARKHLIDRTMNDGWRAAYQIRPEVLPELRP